MKELQRRPRTALEPAASTVVSLPPLRMAAAPAADQASSLKRDYAGVLEYWQMVRRHKLLVVLTSVLGCAIGFILTLPEPRMYQSRITLEIQGLNGDFLNMRNISPTMTATSNEYPDYDIQTQARILQSRSLLRRVSDKIAPRKPPQTLHQADRLSTWRNVLKLSAPTQQDLWKGALGAAAGNVRVRASGTSRIVEITCDSTRFGNGLEHGNRVSII